MFHGFFNGKCLIYINEQCGEHIAFCSYIHMDIRILYMHDYICIFIYVYLYLYIHMFIYIYMDIIYMFYMYTYEQNGHI
jgi:hypothetical protein